jgi:hypothetical protein
MRRWNRIALVILCCAVFSACKTQESPAPATAGTPATCRSSCDASYDRCALACQQTDNNMCSDECVDALESCKKHCG